MLIHLPLDIAHALLHLVVPGRQRGGDGLLRHHRHLVPQLLELVAGDMLGHQFSLLGARAVQRFRQLGERFHFAVEVFAPDFSLKTKKAGEKKLRKCDNKELTVEVDLAYLADPVVHFGNYGSLAVILTL